MLLEFFQNQGLRDFTRLPRNTLQLYTSYLVNRDYSPASINLYMTGAQRYIVWCRDQGVNIPDLARPDKPRMKSRVKEVLTKEQLREYFKGCSEKLKEPTRTALMLMPCCGLRSSEIVELSLNSIQKVQVMMQDGSMKQCLSLRVIGKGNKERLVPLLDEGVQILQQYLSGWRRDRPGHNLFPSSQGDNERYINAHTLWQAFSKVVKEELGLTRATPHILRRTYATTLWGRGVADTTIAKILGHENLQTLYKHYLNMSATDLSTAVHHKGGSLLGR